MGAGVMDIRYHDAVAPIVNAVGHLEREAHLYTGFIRFTQNAGVLAAVIEPKNRVLSLIADHFVDRYPNDAFIIFDRTHREALVAQSGHGQIVPLESLELPEPDDMERAVRALWRRFHTAIGIAQRKNRKCQRSHLPMRYRRVMTELPQISAAQRKSPSFLPRACRRVDFPICPVSTESPRLAAAISHPVAGVNAKFRGILNGRKTKGANLLPEVLGAVLRAAYAYLLALIVARLIGRKSISQMTFFDFVVGISLGSLTAMLGIGEHSTLANATIAILTFCALTIITSLAVLGNMKLQKLIDSEPLVLIARGELVKVNMRRARITLNRLTMLLREKNAFNIIDVEYAILEIDGKLSVLMKADKKPATPSDLCVSPPYEGLVAELVIDGRHMRENLKRVGKDEAWLNGQLKEKGIQRIGDVLFAALDSANRLYLTLGASASEEPGKYGIE
jgi:uncharacterized membrane protein YcaP (DUF421 family)